MRNVELKTVIAELEKLRQKFIKAHDVEPVVWSIDSSEIDYDGKILVEVCFYKEKHSSGSTLAHGNVIQKAIRIE